MFGSGSIQPKLTSGIKILPTSHGTFNITLRLLCLFALCHALGGADGPRAATLHLLAMSRMSVTIESMVSMQSVRTIPVRVALLASKLILCNNAANEGISSHESEAAHEPSASP